jgi:gas vesicle protein
MFKSFGDYRASDRSSVGTAVTFLFIGLGAGALAALLFAPQSGKQTRRLLKRKYDDAVGEIGERTDEWIEKGTEWARDAKEAAEEKIAPLRNRVKNL